MRYEKQTGLKYPKKVKPKRGKTPESELQDFTNHLLQAKRIFNIRIPNSLGQALMGNPQVPIHIKKIYSDTFSGLPDNICMVPLDREHGIGIYLALELKRVGGKLSIKQRDIQGELGTDVEDTPAGVEKAVALLEKVVELSKEVKE